MNDDHAPTRSEMLVEVMDSHFFKTAFLAGFFLIGCYRIYRGPLADTNYIGFLAITAFLITIPPLLLVRTFKIHYRNDRTLE
jgi:hypothetical protein